MIRNCSLLLKSYCSFFSPQWWKSTRYRTRSWPHHFWAPRKSPGWREIWNLERELSGWRKIQNIEREVWVEENIDFRMIGVRFNLLYKSSKYKPDNLEGSHRLWRRVQEDLYLHLQGKDDHLKKQKRRKRIKPWRWRWTWRRPWRRRRPRWRPRLASRREPTTAWTETAWGFSVKKKTKYFSRNLPSKKVVLTTQYIKLPWSFHQDCIFLNTDAVAEVHHLLKRSKKWKYFLRLKILVNKHLKFTALSFMRENMPPPMSTSPLCTIPTFKMFIFNNSHCCRTRIFETTHIVG